MAAQGSLTVLFEEPFWIGLYERLDGGRYRVCRIVFGAEPKDYEIYELLLSGWGRLDFSPPIPAEALPERRISPKRQQREIAAAMENRGVGTKAQQAIKLQQEQGKLARRTLSRARREEESDRRFALRQEKKKEKHRGR